MSKFSEDLIKLFEEFKKKIGKYQDLNLEDIELEEKKLIDFGDGVGICKQRMGFTPKTISGGNIYFYKVGDLSKVQGIEITNPRTEEKTIMGYINEAVGKGSEKAKPIQKGDILVSFKLTIGVTKIYNSDEIAYCNEAIDILTPKKGYYNKYLAFIVGEKYQEKAKVKTVKGTSLNKESKDKIYIPIPKQAGNYTSFDIQKAIVEFIEHVSLTSESVVNLMEDIIKITKKGKENLICKLFQSPSRNINEDVIKLFEEFKKKTKDCQNLNLKNIEFDYYQLKNLFEAKGGNSEYTKKYITEHPGEYPLLTGKLDNESIEAYIDTYNFEGECITYNKDNAGGSRAFYRPKGFKFSMNSHHIALFKKESLPDNINDLDYKYSMYVLNRLFETNKYGWETSANWDRIQKEIIPIPKPISNYTSYDIQKAIAEFIEHVYKNFDNLILKAKENIEKTKIFQKCLLIKVFQ